MLVRVDQLLCCLVCKKDTLGYNKYEDRVRFINEFQGVTLGSSFSDVEFRLGNLTQKMDEDGKPKDNDYKINQIHLAFQDGKLEHIGYVCLTDGTYERTSLNGISCKDTSETILGRFGPSTRVLCFSSKEPGVRNLVRAYDSVENGVRYILEQNRVVFMVLVEPKALLGYTDKNFSKCPGG